MRKWQTGEGRGGGVSEGARPKGLPDGPTPRAVPNQFGNRKERRAWRKQERIANASRKSVRTVSGGLPSLGRKR